MPTNERQRIAVLEKALKVLEIFGPATPELRLDEISKLTGFSKSSCQRLVHTLVKLNYLKRFENRGGYCLSNRALDLSFAYLRFNQMLQTVSPHLSRLAEATGLRVDLTVLDGNDVVFLSRVPSRVEAFNISPVGRRAIALSSASGRMLVSFFDEERLQQLFKDTDVIKLTSKTIVDKNLIRELIEKARVDGYAYQLGEVLEGAASLAAPILGQSGAPVGAITIGTTVSDLENPDRRNTLVTQLLKVTQGLSNMAMSV